MPAPTPAEAAEVCASTSCRSRFCRALGDAASLRYRAMVAAGAGAAAGTACRCHRPSHDGATNPSWRTAGAFGRCGEPHAYSIASCPRNSPLLVGALPRRHQAVVRLADTNGGRECRIATRHVDSQYGMAVSRDGSTLLVADATAHCVREYNAADGTRLRAVGSRGDGKLEFASPSQLWVSSDGFVFIAEAGNARVQVLTSRLRFHAFIGVGKLKHATGVCANNDVVVVSELAVDRISVFSRK
jgi:hypothetical protein